MAPPHDEGAALGEWTGQSQRLRIVQDDHIAFTDSMQKADCVLPQDALEMVGFGVARTDRRPPRFREADCGDVW